MSRPVRFAHVSSSPVPDDDEYRVPRIARRSSPVTSDFDGGEYAVPRSASEYGVSGSYVGERTPPSPYQAVTPSPPSDAEALPPRLYRPSLALEYHLDYRTAPKTLSLAMSVYSRPATQPPVHEINVQFLPWVWRVAGTGAPLPYGGYVVTVGDVVSSLRLSMNKKVRPMEYNNEDEDRREVIRGVFWSRADKNRGALENGLLREDFLEGRDIVGFKTYRNSNTIEVVVKP
ncbi:hypothetical protein K488DRAFT_73925 [Vararia minispora EC-137]|uniref:Uncharacterized protein n=1 Tax=Vararia minispora EC-137 TaxID=1314806 RepID=A0ACB8Q9L8_9AGAM|nr:hypothetical protein K488DRAFT_73925 [Vararia minispora EC-137]